MNTVRLKAVDFMKGFGVISFILWHCYDYFYAMQQGRPPINRFILYTTGIFIFMSGYIVGYHYFQKYNKGSNKEIYAINKRLTVRALKLILYVYIANIILKLISSREIGSHSILETFTRIASLFYVDRWDITFQVLIVIGVGLIISGIVLSGYIKYHGSIVKYILLIILAVSLYDAANSTSLPYLWRYLPLSIMGTIFGLYFYNEKWRNGFIRGYYLFLVIALTICIASTLSSQIQRYVMSETGPYLVLNICVFMAIGVPAYKILDQKNISSDILMDFMGLIGQYSLLIYFVHLISLRIISQLYNEIKFESNMPILCIWLILLMASYYLAKITSWMRKRRIVNWIYELIFA